MLQWIVFGCSLLVALNAAQAQDAAAFERLGERFSGDIRPLLEQHCLDCHASEVREGELDLERFGSLAEIRRDPAAWQKVAEILANSEMPPEGSPQLSTEQKQTLQRWLNDYLHAEARANAGDPGPVALRRLNNAEYTYTIRDLTGVPLDPAREFPVDGAAGEGFTNTGIALAMSPALAEKYFAAARKVAEHAVLLPDGVAFSHRTTQRDWTNERLFEIQEIYRRHTSGNQDVGVLDRWAAPNPLAATDEDGRVSLAPYFHALLRHRETLLRDGADVEDIARSEGLNARYFSLLVDMLASDAGPSLLLDHLRTRWRTADSRAGDALVAEISAWQEALWRFDGVGHLGFIRPWQAPVSPVSESREFRVKLRDAGAGEDLRLHLTVGAAGIAGSKAQIEWRDGRFERPGAAAIPLREVRGIAAVLDRVRRDALSATARHLAAAFEARTASHPLDPAELAGRHGVDPEILQGWLTYLGVRTEGAVEFGELLHRQLADVGGHKAVRGWVLPGAADLSIVSNASEQAVNIPGAMRPHRVAVHPRPERWVAAGWQSPLTGTVNIAAEVQDAHRGCGNGVEWSLEMRRGSQRRVLRSGVINAGAVAQIEPVDSLAVQSGDVIALSIGPRDGNHFCDLTEIDLRIEESGGERRSWSLAGDCADDILKGNPHPDRHGNPAIWRFASGMLADLQDHPAVPPGSLVSKWLDTQDKSEAAGIAEEISRLLTQPLSEESAAPDAALRTQLRSISGPLFGRIDVTRLSAQATPDELQAGTHGVDPQRFAASENVLTAGASEVVTMSLPEELLAGSEFVVTARLAPQSAGAPIVQPVVGAEPALHPAALMPGVPFLVQRETPAESFLLESFEDFRQLFPRAMCYARIVPVDEVVTLVLFHREDEHLSRLMLGAEEAERLDQLWNELFFVSEAAFRTEVALEQILEFATQDADPSRFDPVRQPIADAAERLRQTQLAAEPRHVAWVIEFAGKAHRRPMTPSESRDIQALYDNLRAENIPHEEAIRLLIARVLASPSFLYRLDIPPEGTRRAPVSNRELAARLSYFLWSSCPDEKLAAAAANGDLTDERTLLRQTSRMLHDDRVRRLAIEFACQWLQIRNFDQHDEKSEQRFPEFAGLREAMYEESVRFFTDLFQNDRSILTIFDSDHTFLNEKLARHYGIEGVEGEGWRRVDGLESAHRGGILTQASFLASQSGASRTSPILRGAWVSETLLNERLPRPPKDVPLLPDSPPDGLTERQLIEQHSSLPGCAKCHERIDPYGFALENFDAIGRWRMLDAQGHPIDVHSVLRDGAKLNGVEGLQQHLLTTRRDDVVRQFCRKLLGYALGRATLISDEPLLDEMQRRLEEEEYRFSAAVETIVLSDQFRMLRGRDDPRAALEVQQ
jgi:hypothetical protein